MGFNLSMEQAQCNSEWVRVTQAARLSRRPRFPAPVGT